MKRGELRGKISTRPGLNRYLRVPPGGLLRVDRAKMKTEANLDGKHLLRCSEPHLSATDIALGYTQLLEVERGWRDMKQILDTASNNARPRRAVLARAAPDPHHRDPHGYIWHHVRRHPRLQPKPQARLLLVGRPTDRDGELFPMGGAGIRCTVLGRRAAPGPGTRSTP